MRRFPHKRLISRAAFALLGFLCAIQIANAAEPGPWFVITSSGVSYGAPTDQQACAKFVSEGRSHLNGRNPSVSGRYCNYEYDYDGDPTDPRSTSVFITQFNNRCPGNEDPVDGQCPDPEPPDQCDPSTLAKGSRFTMTNRSEWDRAISGGRFQSGGYIYTVDGDIPGMWSNGKGTLWGDKTCEEVSQSPTEPQPQDPENTEDADFCATTAHGDEICAIDKPESCDGFYGSINGQNTCVPKTPNIDSTNCAESSNGTKVCYDPTQWYDDDGNEVERDAEVRDANNTEGDLYGPSSPASTTSNSGSGDGGDGSNGGGTGGNGDGEGEEPCTGEDCNTVKVDEEGTPGADEYTDQMDGAWDEPFNEQQEAIEDWNLPEAFPDPDFDVTLPSGDGCQQVNLAYATWSVAVPNAQGCALLTQVKQAFSWLLGFITVLYLIMLFLNAKASGD